MGKKVETVTDFIFLSSKNHCRQWVIAAIKLKDAYSFEKSYDQPRQSMKRQTHDFAYKDPYSQGYGFSSSHVWMWELP